MTSYVSSHCSEDKHLTYFNSFGSTGQSPNPISYSFCTTDRGRDNKLAFFWSHPKIFTPYLVKLFKVPDGLAPFIGHRVLIFTIFKVKSIGFCHFCKACIYIKCHLMALVNLIRFQFTPRKKWQVVSYQRKIVVSLLSQKGTEGAKVPSVEGRHPPRESIHYW